MKLRLSLLLMVFAVSATSALGYGAFDVIGVGTSTGISKDGVAIGIINYGGVLGDYIYSEAYGAVKIGDAGRGVGVASYATGDGRYAIVYNSNAEGFYKSYAWVGTLDGVGTTTADAYSTSTKQFWSRGMSQTSNAAGTEFYVGGNWIGSTTANARWKAPSGSVTGYNQPSNFASTVNYFYSASDNGTYAGWGRLSDAGTVANKSQAMVLQSGALVSLRNGWGAPSQSYYSNAYISGDAATCFGYTGASDNSTAVACYWEKGAAFTTDTVCNLIPFLDGYGKAYAMKSDTTASLIAGWTIKTGGETGIDRRTIFLFNKATGVVTDLRSVLAANGVDLSGWGFMDITGISGDGTKLTGTMLPATDAYWTGGSVTGPYYTWAADLTKVVPEPGSILALVTGLAGLAGFGIRRTK